MTMETTQMIQEQHWKDCDRVIVVDTENNASVQVDLLKEEREKERFHADALLWALWVDKEHRRKGVARKLMETAEREARERGCKTISLHWDDREAKRWTLDWYMRRGYREVEFGRHQSLLVKTL